MTEAAHKVEAHEEYWRPPVSVATGRAQAGTRCGRCGAEYPQGARFCHVCGAGRGTAAAHDWKGALRQLWEAVSVRQSLGLSLGPTLALAAAGVCVLLALITGWTYSVNNLADWQAVQTWRVEWLLAAVVAVLTGILLRRS